MTHPLEATFKQLASLQEQAKTEQLELFRSTAASILRRKEGRLESIEMWAYGQSYTTVWKNSDDQEEVSKVQDELYDLAPPVELDLMINTCTVYYEDVE